MEALECGAASLCMVLAFYGKWLPLEQVRADCGVSRDGSNARNIIKAARSYQLKASGHRMEPSGLQSLNAPAILHWNFNHFVVFCGFRKNQAVINDPARGRIEVDQEEFNKAFTGIVLRFEKDENFRPEGKPRSVAAFAFQRLRGTLVPFLFVVLTGILSSVVGLAMPLFSRVFLDNILSESNPEWLWPLVAVLSAAVLFQFSVGVMEGIYWLKIEGRFAVTANTEYFWHVLRLPLEFFSQRFIGDIVSRQIMNQSIAGTLIRQLAPIFMNVCLLAFYLAIMWHYSVLLTVIGVSSVLLNLIAGRTIARKQVDLSRLSQASAGKLAGFTVTGIHMIETIKAGGAEEGFFERWAGYYAAYHNAQVRIASFWQYVGSLPSLLQQMAGIAILIAGTSLILRGEFTIGMLMAFQGFLSALLNPVKQLLEVGQSFITMRAEMERVEDVMNYPTDAGLQRDEAPDAGLQRGKLKGALELRELTFGYSRLSDPLLRNFSLSIPAGSSVALVGGSGSGKSTLAKLITGLYPAWSGEILFDGRKRAEIDEYTYKSSVAMVDQEITLFEDTIANNIRMWDSSIEDFVLILAARDADIHQTIISRPDGFHHRILEGGKNFSGGQRQRFEIARVLAQEPTLIILDEATSALDAKTEEMVMRNIRNLGATCIVIAHRLSAVRDCDQIVVLDRGVAVERGTHQELLALGGKYTQLISTDIQS